MITEHRGDTYYLERRRADRYEPRILGLVNFDNQVCKVKIVNISASGMKIWGTELQKDQSVEIGWQDGDHQEKIEATVVWTIGEASGLKFKTLLTEDHPLLRENLLESA